MSTSMSASLKDERSFHVIEVVPDRLEGEPAAITPAVVAGSKGTSDRGSLVPGANVSAIAREARMAASPLFGRRRKALKGDTPNRRANEGLGWALSKLPRRPRRLRSRSAE